jgi:hypothetical protein
MCDEPFRDQLVSVDMEDVNEAAGGLVIRVQRSKSGPPRFRLDLCSARWIRRDCVSQSRMNAGSVARLIRRTADAARLNPGELRRRPHSPAPDSLLGLPERVPPKSPSFGRPATNPVHDDMPRNNQLRFTN